MPVHEFLQPPLRIPEHILDAVTSRRLELIVLPTEKCNLRCTYCYEDFEIGRMKPPVVSGIKNLISARAADLDLLELSWFGGEPLLAAPQILDICAHAQAEAARHSNLRVRSGMTTNGVLLTADMAARLDQAGVTSYQISLDGPKDVHDLSRITASGGGSFDAIWGNLKAMAETDLGFTVYLRVHFQYDNWQAIHELIDQIRDTFGGDPRFQTFFRPIIRMGGKNDAQIKILTSQERQEIEHSLESRLRGKPVDANALHQPALTAAPAANEPQPESKPPVCYAAQANSLVIRATGAINKCTVALSDDRNDVGRLNPDGTITINQSKFAPWLRGIATQNLNQLKCPYASHMSSFKPAKPEGRVIAIQPVAASA